LLIKTVDPTRHKAGALSPALCMWSSAYGVGENRNQCANITLQTYARRNVDKDGKMKESSVTVALFYFFF